MSGTARAVGGVRGGVLCITKHRTDGYAIICVPAKDRRTRCRESLTLSTLNSYTCAKAVPGDVLVLGRSDTVGAAFVVKGVIEMPTSKLQARVREVLRARFPLCTIRENYRPEWFTTPEGQRLEMDFFIEDLYVAFEVQGQQHYQFVSLFHASYEDFEAQLKRDAAKRDMCDRLGIALYEVVNESQCVEAISVIEHVRKVQQSSLDYHLDSNKMRFLLNKSRDLRARMGKTRATIYGLISGAQRYNKLGKPIPVGIRRQLYHHVTMYENMQGRLARKTAERSIFYDTKIAPMIEAGVLEEPNDFDAA